jgi:hypothetical protein
MKELGRVVVASGFEELLEMLAEDLAAGVFEYDGDVLSLRDEAWDERTLGGFADGGRLPDRVACRVRSPDG